jgi:hypothetical protein
LRLPLLTLLALLCAGRARAQLATVSPFLPAAAAAANAPTAGAPLEFRGVLEDSDGLKFRIVDPARKTGVWMKLNERDPNLDCVVKQHSGEGEQETVVVEQGGRTYTLAVHTAKVVSSGAGGQPMAAPPPGLPAGMPPAIVNTVNVNPTPAQEQARLQAVADEVARRRALREQAAQQVNQGQAAAVAQQVIQQQQAALQAQQQQRQQQNAQGQPPGNNPRGQRGQGGFRQRNQ